MDTFVTLLLGAFFIWRVITLTFSKDFEEKVEAGIHAILIICLQILLLVPIK